MMRKMILSVLCCAGTALFLTACGEQKPTDTKTPAQKVAGTVKETVKGADKVADHATGKAQLEQKKKMESRINKIQQDQQKRLQDASK